MMRRTRLKADPEKTRAWQQRSRKPMKRSPLKARNEGRIAKRHQAYAKVLRSAFHRKLRYLAWERSGGLCECEACVKVRHLFTRYVPLEGRGGIGPGDPSFADVQAAFTPVPVWFVKKGNEAWQRFRSNDGEIHHTSYRLYGKEDDTELQYVRWMWKAHHRAIEAEHGTRRRYLMTGTA